MNKINIGVDVGGTTINIGAVTPEGNVIRKITVNTNAKNGSNAIIDSIIEGISSLLCILSSKSSDIKSIGIGFPGTVDSKKGIVVFAPNIFFENVDVRTKMAAEFGCPIFLGQDSRAAAWGEYCVGAGKNCPNMAAITIGTGIGCGLILGGKVFHGANNTAGEFGHQLINPDGYQCNCGKKGCLETYCAGLAIVRESKKIADNLSVKDVYDLAAKGNCVAQNISRQVVINLGIGMVNLINLTSIDLIAISGGISNAPDDLLLNPLVAFVRERAYSAVAQKVKIVHSLLGDTAPLVGASLLDETTE